MTATGPGTRPPSDVEPFGDGAFRILSIDGGGIRGIIPAVLLETLEAFLAQALREAGRRTAQAWRDRGIEEPHIADCFHLIAGTSTGGLLTAALTIPDPNGHPKLSAAEAVGIYESKGAAIFARPPLRRIFDPFALLFPKYPLKQLRVVLSDPSLFGDALLADACTDVLLASYDATAAKPRLFTRWDAAAATGDSARPGLTMVDVALASAAAPTYFNPQHVEDIHFVDGGVFAGNPALAAISVALRRTEQPAPLQPAKLLMLSLGTGSWEKPLDYGWGGILGWLRPHGGGEALLEAMLNGQTDSAAESAHMILNGWVPASGQPSTEAMLPRELVGGGPHLWRYQPSLPGPWAMDDTSHIQALKQVALDTARQYEDELRRLAALLIAKGPVRS